jgi:hypothetical protein
MPRLSALLIAIALVAPSLRVGADEWLEFRGVGGASRVKEGSLPVELSAADVRWSVDLPGRGLSGVLVVDIALRRGIARIRPRAPPY